MTCRGLSGELLSNAATHYMPLCLNDFLQINGGFGEGILTTCSMMAAARLAVGKLPDFFFALFPSKCENVLEKNVQKRVVIFFFGRFIKEKTPKTE